MNPEPYCKVCEHSHLSHQFPAVCRDCPNGVCVVPNIERVLREKYEPITDAETYSRLRRVCGLGGLIEGEVVDRKAIEG